MRRAWQTPHGARPNREGFPASLRACWDACRLGAPQPPGRSLEPPSNARPRGMTVLPATADRIRLTGPAANNFLVCVELVCVERTLLSAAFDLALYLPFAFALSF